MKRIVSVLLLLVLVAAMAVPAYAVDGQVTYYRNAKKFIFLPGTEESPTDLFHEFKDVMPGDTIGQRILVRNAAANKRQVKLYMRALGAQEGSEAFLSQLRLTVTKLTDTVLFEAPADQTAQLTDWVYLGTLRSGGECELLAELHVPVSVDNEFQNAIGYLDWEFAVEELPGGNAQTGDQTPVWLWMGLVTLSGAALVLLPVIRRRKNRN